MLVVLYLRGRRYPLGPSRDWEQHLDTLQEVLLDGTEMVRDATQAIVRHTASQRIVYRLALEPWPTEREVWSLERS